jgi:AcrR family transcriptional regulator
VTPGSDVVERQLRADRYSAAQQRVIAAALELFAVHGVSGTSLQMIADAVGVTKAAVYHQFKTKEEIVLAVAEVELAPLEDTLIAAEAQTTDDHARVVLLEQVIALAVRRRRWVYALQNDPAMVRLLGEYEPFLDLMNRLYSVLNGEDATTETLVRTAILSAAFGGAVVHPLVAGLDDQTLQYELVRTARRLFNLPDE